MKIANFQLTSKTDPHLLALIGSTFRISFTIPPPPTAKKGGHSETLLNTCIAHSNSANLPLFNNASDWLRGDFDNENQ